MNKTNSGFCQLINKAAIFIRCDKVVPGLGTTHLLLLLLLLFLLLLLLLPVSDFFQIIPNYQNHPQFSKLYNIFEIILNKN
jgi:hypothetical protein